MKKCTTKHGCGLMKDESEFDRNKLKSDGLNAICKQCNLKYKQNYRRTKKGLINQMYSNQKKNSERRKLPEPTYTKDELYDWVMAQPIFHVMFTDWEYSGYKKNMVPTCDRHSDIDDSYDSKPYDLSALRIQRWEDNKLKYHEDAKNGVNNKLSKPVAQYHIDGSLIAEFHSGRDAERKTGFRSANISKCCKGLIKQSGGYIWKYI